MIYVFMLVESTFLPFASQLPKLCASSLSSPIPSTLAPAAAAVHVLLLAVSLLQTT
jgi:hypothetical protein